MSESKQSPKQRPRSLDRTVLLEAANRAVKSNRTQKKEQFPALLNRYQPDPKLRDQLIAQVNSSNLFYDFLVYYLEEQVYQNLKLETYGHERAMHDGQMLQAATLLQILKMIRRD